MSFRTAVTFHQSESSCQFRILWIEVRIRMAGLRCGIVASCKPFYEIDFPGPDLTWSCPAHGHDRTIRLSAHNTTPSRNRSVPSSCGSLGVDRGGSPGPAMSVSAVLAVAVGGRLTRCQPAPCLGPVARWLASCSELCGWFSAAVSFFFLFPPSTQDSALKGSIWVPCTIRWREGEWRSGFRTKDPTQGARDSLPSRLTVAGGWYRYWMWTRCLVEDWKLIRIPSVTVPVPDMTDMTRQDRLADWHSHWELLRRSEVGSGRDTGMDGSSEQYLPMYAEPQRSSPLFVTKNSDKGKPIQLFNKEPRVGFGTGDSSLTDPWRFLFGPHCSLGEGSYGRTPHIHTECAGAGRCRTAGVMWPFRPDTGYRNSAFHGYGPDPRSGCLGIILAQLSLLRRVEECPAGGGTGVASLPRVRSEVSAQLFVVAAPPRRENYSRFGD
ncbi:hypothetical protein V8F20_010514 [Naviculisporaceae sp. PSN 640]